MSTNDGTFSLPGVPLYPGTNALVVRLRDVSGNESEQTRTVVRTNTLETFQYDGNGNLTNWVKAGENWVYEWDWADRLVRVRSNGVVVLENWYDASGRRIAKTELLGNETRRHFYIYDKWQGVAVLNESAEPVESFIHGLGMATSIGSLVAVTYHPAGATNGVFYTHHNHRGDTIGARASTVTIGTYDYSAFGTLRRRTGVDLCRYKFSNRELDESAQLHYYGHRYYHTGLQRWINPEPIRELGGLNFYAFVRNSPINNIDLGGLIPVPVVTGLVGCGAGIVTSLFNSWLTQDNARTAACKAAVSCAVSGGFGALAGVFPRASGCLAGLSSSIADQLGGYLCDKKYCPSSNPAATCAIIGGAISGLIGCALGGLPSDQLGGEPIKFAIEKLVSSVLGTVASGSCNVGNNWFWNVP
ncbi:MAG: hypothetical protein N3A53_04985 [Verrucomicrobiae bacterium]|nr:hypothetical protein [Verrucomicrobiae bacterium]